MFHVKNQLGKRGLVHMGEAAKWQPYSHGGCHGWRFPVYDLDGNIIAYRWKNADSSSSRKYLWLPRKPDNPAADWYILPETKQAISRAGGEVYLANGEPALLAYHAAGVPNVITTTLSEISVPQNMLQMLRDLGVTRLLYPVDNDAAGKQSAVKWREALRESGIDFVAFSWGNNAPAKADANDIWIDVNFERDTFQRKLNNLPKLSLPTPAPRQKEHRFDSYTFDETPAGLVQAILSAVSERGYHGTGEWINGNCLFHDDKNASAGIHMESGVCNCFACGTFSSWDVAEKLGIDPKRFYSSKKRRKAAKNRKKQLTPQQLAERMASRVNPVTDAVGYSPTLTVNEPYISDVDDEHLKAATILIKSALATGKTTLIQRIIENLPDHTRILLVTYRRTLTRNLADRLDFCNYDDVNDGELSLSPRIVITVDSLHKLEHAPRYHLVAIDEMEQVTRHFWGGTMRGGEPSQAYRILSQHLRDAQQVVALDAHMTDISRDWLAYEREGKGSLSAIENTFRPDRGNLQIVSSQSGLIEIAFDAAESTETGCPVVMVTDSRRQTQVLTQMARERFGHDAVLLINGHTSSGSEQQAFIAAINDAEQNPMQDYRVIIGSPSISTGLDIQQKVAGVYGMFSRARWLNADDIMQAMMRFRNAKSYQLYVSMGRPEHPAETDPDVIDWQELQRAKRTGEASGFRLAQVEAVTREQRVLTRLYARHTARTNAQHNDLFSHVCHLAGQEGFEITFRSHSSEQVNDAMSAARETLQQVEKAETIIAETSHPDTYRAMQMEGGYSESELEDTRRGVTRYLVEQAAGQQITEVLYDELHTTRKRRHFYNLLDYIQNNPDELKQRDIAEAVNLPMQRSHFTQVMQLIREGLLAVFPDGLQSTEHLTKDEVNERMADFLAEQRGNIELFIDSRKGLSDDPIFILKRLLKGIKMEIASDQVSRDGQRVRVYWICQKRVQQMMQLAEVAFQAQEQGGYDPLTGDYSKPYTDTYRYTVLSRKLQESRSQEVSTSSAGAEKQLSLDIPPITP